ncbi:MAG: DUF2442 domain-containing protein [Atopobiaceae bacterium]|nr:DUF2442 domain-containing protein [Atopobiaceae bacterium]
MFKKIASVQPFAENNLVLWFVDGETRLVDALEIIKNHEGYEALDDPELFRSARLAAEGYGVSWDNGLDMGCKELYECGTQINVVDLEGQRLISGVVEARHEKGLSQAKLASAAGVKQPVVARLETGVNSPRLDTLLKVLTPLGKTLKVVDLG